MPNRDSLIWLESTTDSIIESFRSTHDKPIYISSYLNLPRDSRVPLYDKVDVSLTDIVTADDMLLGFKLRCWMMSGALLPLHHHPDGWEFFNLQVGHIIELLSNFHLLPSNTLTLASDHRHLFYAPEDSYMTIEAMLDDPIPIPPHLLIHL